MLSDDKYIEFITAGLNQLTMPSAKVDCDVHIGGRQFDVVASVTVGLHDVLLAYEVKHKKRRIGVEQIEAFITKAKDIGASRIVFVSTSGFQSGCFSLAEKHFVDLFLVKFIDDINMPAMGTFSIMSKPGESLERNPPYISIGQKELIQNIKRVYLNYATGKRWEVPNEPSQMRYYMQKTEMSDGTSLNDLVGQHVPEIKKEGESKLVKIKRHHGRSISVKPPDEFFFPRGKLKSVEIEVVGVLAYPIDGNTEIEPSAFSSTVVYENVKTGEKTEAKAHEIPVGTSSLEPGEFYFNFFPLKYYHCSTIEGDKVKMRLVESFQMGTLVQTSDFTMEIKYSQFYFLLTDKSIKKRLSARLAHMKDSKRP